jgi:hypothetical protein
MIEPQKPQPAAANKQPDVYGIPGTVIYGNLSKIQNLLIVQHILADLLIVSEFISIYWGFQIICQVANPHGAKIERWMS